MRHSTPVRCLLAIALLAASLWIAGCNKITPENYAKINNGMTQEQVDAILGKGADKPLKFGNIQVSSSGMKSVQYGDDAKNITVDYAEGKVIDKAKKGI